MSMKRLYALGRLKPGQMNKTETAYAAHLEREKQHGDVAAYWFESMKIRIAKNCWYCPDFLVMRPSGELELHEVKGARAIFRDDAKVKVKAAAEMFPYRMFVCYPARGGFWEIEEY